MSTTTERLHELVIERAELYAALEFPEWPITAEELGKVLARNNERRARINETYAEALKILTEYTGEENE